MSLTIPDHFEYEIIVSLLFAVCFISPLTLAEFKKSHSSFMILPFGVNNTNWVLKIPGKTG